MTLICLFRGRNYPDFSCGGVPKRALHGAAIGPMVLLEGTPTSPSRGFILSRRSSRKSKSCLNISSPDGRSR